MFIKITDIDGAVYLVALSEIALINTDDRIVTMKHSNPIHLTKDEMKKLIAKLIEEQDVQDGD
jgi:hypothetical protein